MIGLERERGLRAGRVVSTATVGDREMGSCEIGVGQENIRVIKMMMTKKIDGTL
jgi:hypothetical protein